ncbi:MAG: asparagine--tRNA ligase [Fibrobacter sp.]|nr:asparagine--tRNA ligase [Fibrobacter sp.]
MLNKTVKEILKTSQPGDQVKAYGWVRTRRDSKEFSFLEINDGSCGSSLQVIADRTTAGYEDVCKVPTGSSIAVDGIIKQSPGQGQRIELAAQSVNILGLTTADFPLQKKRHSFEFLREIAHLRPRTNTIAAVTRLRSSLSFAIHTFFNERGFFYVHTPLITTSDCEGAGAMFRVTTLEAANPPRTEDGKVDFTKDFFGKPANLTVSGQLEGEIYALAMGRIYTFGPTFRAENSNTPRHLAEFWMIEPEVAFFRLEDDMDLAEDFVRYLANYVLEHNMDDLLFFQNRIDSDVVDRIKGIAAEPFERISYTDAITILEKHNTEFEYKVTWGSDLQSEHERYLTVQVFKKPVIVYNYPKEIKAFYMRLNDDGKTVRAMDVLVPRIGELVGGSEREEREEVLLQRIKDSGLDEKCYWWYMELRKFGSAPHAGFGLGFERLLLLVTGMQNIRDVIPFPRFPGNAEF